MSDPLDMSPVESLLTRALTVIARTAKFGALAGEDYATLLDIEAYLMDAGLPLPPEPLAFFPYPPALSALRYTRATQAQGVVEGDQEDTPDRSTT